MVITPSLCLMYCPICEEKLNIQKMFSSSNSTCSQCDYNEPAGSAHFVTFIIEVLSNFIKNIGVKYISIGEVKTTDFKAVLDSSSLLTAILINAKLNTKYISAHFNQIPLATVVDNNGYYKKRVISTSSNISNPSICISVLAETIYSAYLESMKSDDHRKTKTLDLNLLHPISATKFSSIKYYSENSHLMNTSPLMSQKRANA